MAQRTGSRPDGCAVFCRVSLFDVLDSSVVEYRKEEVLTICKDNIGLVTLLETKRSRGASSSKLVVVTTHLLFSSKRKEVRLAQLALLLGGMDCLSWVST